MQKQRVSMTVETFGSILDLCSRPDGFVSTELAAHLGIDAGAGWTMTDVNTLVGPLGPGRTTVNLFRDIPFDILTVAK
jgi:hypothetical protein